MSVLVSTGAASRLLPHGRAACQRGVLNAWGTREKASSRVVARSLLRAGRPAQSLLLRLHALGREHALLRPARAATLLAPDTLDLLLARARRTPDACLQLLGEPAAGEEPVHRLRARLLALHGDARRHVPQHDAGRDLVHVLPALAARADEALDEIVLADAERGETRQQCGFLFRTDGKHRGSARRYTSVTAEAAAGRRKRWPSQPGW